MINPRAKYHETFRFTFQEALQFYKRKHGLTTAEIADRIGTDKNTVDHWLQGIAVPQMPGFFALLDVFGPALLNSVLRPFGYGHCEVLDDDITPQPMAVVGACAAFISHTATAMEDGRIDHAEAADVLRQAQEAQEQLAGLMATLRRDFGHVKI